LQLNSTGNRNVAVGGGALLFNTLGDTNVGVGNLALTNNTLGYSNIAIGNTSMASNTTAYNNIAIGNSADSGNHNNTIVIGNNITASSDNSIIIGNDSQTTYINGTLSTPAIILNGKSLETTLESLATTEQVNTGLTEDPQITGQITLLATDPSNHPAILFRENIDTPIGNIVASLNNGVSITSWGNIKFYNDVGAVSTNTVNITPTKTTFNTPVYFGSANATDAIGKLG
jgi:hypothetical protein